MAIPAAHVLRPWNLFTTRAQVGDTLMIEHRPVMSIAANAGVRKIDYRKDSNVTYNQTEQLTGRGGEIGFVSTFVGSYFRLLMLLNPSVNDP